MNKLNLISLLVSCLGLYFANNKTVVILVLLIVLILIIKELNLPRTIKSSLVLLFFVFFTLIVGFQI